MGLDWEKLEELLNPKLKSEAVVQRALGPDYSLEKVCCLVLCCLYVHEVSQQLRPTNLYFLLHEDISYAQLVFE